MEGMNGKMAPVRAAIVILGASGDLAKKKLVPALVELLSCQVLSDDLAIIGSGRTDFSDDEFRKRSGCIDECCCIGFICERSG